MELIVLAFVVVSNIICFMAGASVGQKVDRGEKVELPSLNPVKAYREQVARKEEKTEQDRVNTILENVESYNGTSSGQKDVPRG